MAANLPRLSEYGGEPHEDFNLWFKKFELFVPQPAAADAQNQRHQVLPYYLAGKAFLMYEALPAATKLNYNLVKEALRTRLVPQEHNLLQRQHFMNIQREPGEPLSSFELRVTQAATTAFADFPDDARQSLAKEQFMRGIGYSELQLHLLTQQPATLRDAVQTAEQFEQVRRVTYNSQSVGIRQLDQAVGIRQVEEPSPPTPSDQRLEAVEKSLLTVTEQLSQLLKAPPTTAASESGRPKRPKGTYFRGDCYYCGKHGHIKKECRKMAEDAKKGVYRPVASDGSNPRRCYYCRKEGHLQPDCPLKKKHDEERENPGNE